MIKKKPKQKLTKEKKNHTQSTGKKRMEITGPQSKERRNEQQQKSLQRQLSSGFNDDQGCLFCFIFYYLSFYNFLIQIIRHRPSIVMVECSIHRVICVNAVSVPKSFPVPTKKKTTKSFMFYDSIY